MPQKTANAIQNVLQKYSDDEIINKSFKNGVMDKFGLNNFAEANTQQLVIM